MIFLIKTYSLIILFLVQTLEVDFFFLKKSILTTAIVNPKQQKIEFLFYSNEKLPSILMVLSKNSQCSEKSSLFCKHNYILNKSIFNYSALKFNFFFCTNTIYTHDTINLLKSLKFFKLKDPLVR